MEELIDKLTEFLARPRQITDWCAADFSGENFELYGVPFRVVESEVQDFMMQTGLLHRIVVLRRDELPTAENSASVVYESTVTTGRPYSTKMYDMMERAHACRELAKDLIRTLLPKLSHRARTELHNIEIEDILSILD